MRLEELEVYRLAMDIGERVWAEVARWDYFARDTVGKQWVRAADSVAANLSEGFGRFHFKENRQYGYYGRGSLFETKTWLTKAARRTLISEPASAAFERDLNQLGRRLNAYIKSIGTGPAALREDSPPYGKEVIGHLSLGKREEEVIGHSTLGKEEEEVIGHLSLGKGEEKVIGHGSLGKDEKVISHLSLGKEEEAIGRSALGKEEEVIGHLSLGKEEEKVDGPLSLGEDDPFSNDDFPKPND